MFRSQVGTTKTLGLISWNLAVSNNIGKLSSVQFVEDENPKEFDLVASILKPKAQICHNSCKD